MRSWLHPGGGVAPAPEIQVAPGLTPRQAAVALLVMQPAPEIQDGCMVHLLLALLFAGRPRIFQQIYIWRWPFGPPQAIWAILGNFEPLGPLWAIWSTLGHFGQFGPSGPSWATLGNQGPPWAIWATLGHLGHIEPLWVTLGHFGHFTNLGLTTQEEEIAKSG